MDHVHKPHNLSAVLRTCDAVGIGEIHAVSPAAHFRKLGHTSGGAKKWVDVVRWTSLDEAFSHLKQQGFRCYAAHLDDKAVDYREIDYTQPMALVLGAEKFGISDEALAQLDGTVTIPMHGMVQSFNVSVAAAVILAEAQRQRDLAGLYNTRHIDDQTFRTLLFEWSWPDVADYCQRHHVPYPDIDENGQLLQRLDELEAEK